ncbi:hypothetical protein [Herbaspirillum sp. GW103]|uniref:hypothetical protein n=1 Tax=Herbaspirillum sp. GW103 TaxID=1175306 RepID=UPI000550885B|nr:hypothetical protein [Herbaspirillum sp. GW103]
MSCRSTFICLLVLLLTACAASNVDRDFSLENNPDQGIVIASVSFDRAGSRNSQAMFYLDEGIPGAPVPARRLEALPEHATIRMGSQFKDSYGQVLAISLPAGRHTISSWRLVRSAAYSLSPSEKMPPLEFHVAAGKVQYIGNLHLNLVEGKNMLGLRMVADASPEIRDRQDRDLPIIKKKYPQFADRMEIRLLPLGTWEGGRTTIRDIQPVVIVPVK